MGPGRALSRHLATDTDVRRAMPRRLDSSDKYGHGTLLIVGGSSSYYGAPVLATNSAMQSIAALRMGVGYVRSYVPGSILGAARSFSPNAIVEPLGRNHVVFNREIKGEIERSDALLIGMGIGPSEGERRATSSMVRHALGCGKRVVADAGAIGAMKGIPGGANSGAMIMPHTREMSRFIGGRVPEGTLEERISISMAAAARYGIVVVLKGHATIITDGKRFRINAARTAALSSMGTGDVLSGIAAAYAAQCKDMFVAAVAAVRLHSRIGDYLHTLKGNHVIATDVIEAIPAVAKRFD